MFWACRSRMGSSCESLGSIWGLWFDSRCRVHRRRWRECAGLLGGPLQALFPWNCEQLRCPRSLSFSHPPTAAPALGGQWWRKEEDEFSSLQVARSSGRPSPALRREWHLLTSLLKQDGALAVTKQLNSPAPLHGSSNKHEQVPCFLCHQLLGSSILCLRQAPRCRHRAASPGASAGLCFCIVRYWALRHEHGATEHWQHRTESRGSTRPAQPPGSGGSPASSSRRGVSPG